MRERVTAPDLQPQGPRFESRRCNPKTAAQRNKATTTQSKATAHRPAGLRSAEQSARSAQRRKEHMRDLSLKMKTQYKILKVLLKNLKNLKDLKNLKNHLPWF